MSAQGSPGTLRLGRRSTRAAVLFLGKAALALRAARRSPKPVARGNGMSSVSKVERVERVAKVRKAQPRRDALDAPEARMLMLALCLRLLRRTGRGQESTAFDDGDFEGG